MPRVTTEQKIETVKPWIGKQVRVTYDKHTKHTANCDGIPQWTDVVVGLLIGISARIGTYQNSGGWVYDLVIQIEESGLVTISVAKTLTINEA